MTNDSHRDTGFAEMRNAVRCFCRLWFQAAGTRVSLKIFNALEI